MKRGTSMDPAGTYKGYRIEDSERPLDPDGQLNWDDGT